MNYCPKCGCQVYEDDNYCTNCGTALNLANNTSPNNEKQEPVVDKNIYTNKNTGLKNDVIWIILFIICFCLVIGYNTEDTKTPRLPKDLECVQYKDLCIATTDVKYDYTSVQSPDPRYYNSTWNNGWASAQNACKEWGGRLPYMEEFPTILEAYFENKIKLEENRTYLSATEINWHRVYAFSNSWVVTRDKKYNKKNIYDNAISIAKSADWNITGDYSTSTVYDWAARCVK